MTEPIIHSETVLDEWIDYNGHMTEACYVLVFGHATDALYDHVGMDANYRAANARSIYTVEAHMRYLREVPPRARLNCRIHVLSADEKRIRLFHEMFVGEKLAATSELMVLHVDTGTTRTTPFPAAIGDRLQELSETDWPNGAGRAIGD